MKIEKFLVFLISVMGLNGCSSVKTNKSWEQATLLSQALPGISIRAVEVINDSTVYFAANDGQMGFTTNLGKTWNMETLEYDTLKPSFRAIAKTEDAVFMLSIANPALLYNWKEGKKNLVYRESNPDVFYDAMAFFDEQNGIAFGDAVDGCFSFLLTEDGGNSWHKIACENLPEMVDGEVAYAASNTNIAVVGDHAWIVTGGTVSRVWHSKDNGKSWEISETPILHGGKMTGIYSVDFRDKENGIIIGGDWDAKENNKSNKALTKDGGKSWYLIADGEEPGYKSCVKYVPNSNGKQIIAVGSTGISYSQDGGVHWKKINDEGFYTIRFVNETTAVLAGEGKFGVLRL